MYLKSITLRGFKSFASSTTLRFEPGITCVVGPNGSGKSNVVDALAWVMGEQGAKSLRGGKMEDVIFAGTAGRPPLGRAEVVLTIDNSDGALPIDYTEVTISRTLFRNGGSEYAINGQACRLLDIQELLSDSGIGREMHVVVGQGQLDSVLSAGPEERRGFIEEAAGVLKHRKRKEKALRKLEAMEANLTRIQDLTAELRRQLKPLGRQAEVAKRAAVIQADLRDSRLRLLADDLIRLTATLEQEVADETALRERRTDVEQALGTAREREGQLEQAIHDLAPRLARAQETWYRLSSLRERLRGTGSLAAERARHLAAELEDQRAARDPDEIETEGRRVRAQEAELGEQVTAARDALVAAVAARGAAEAAAQAEDKRLAMLVRAAADRREGLARLAGQVATVRSRTASADAEIGRLTAARAEAQRGAEQAQREFAALETTIAGLSAGEEGLDAAYESAQRALADIEQELVAAVDEEREAERERSALGARLEALELGLARKDGSGSLLAAGDQLSGLLGSVAALLAVEPGWEGAVAAALGLAADAVAVGGWDNAFAAVDLLKVEDLGRASLLVSGGAFDDEVSPWPELPAGARYALDLVTAPGDLRPALTRLLRHVAIVEDLKAARALVKDLPDVTAVTRAGDVIGRDLVHGGSSSTPSLLEVQAAVDEARDRLVSVERRAVKLRTRIDELGSARQAGAEHVSVALARLNESDAALAAVAEQLGQLGQAARSATGEADRLTAAMAKAQESSRQATSGLAELEQRLAAAEQAGDSDAEPPTDERDRLHAAASQARQAETESRLTLRTLEERARALAGRAESLERAARLERAAQAAFVARQEQRTREKATAASVLHAVDVVLARLEGSLAAAAEQRQEADTARVEADAELIELRARLRGLSADLDELTSTVHRDEIARAEQRMRIEQLSGRAMEEFGIDTEVLLDEYGPHVLVPPSLPAPGEEPSDEEPKPYVRAVQEKRARAADRALALLGKVNPLALEEFAALEERHQFLTEQLEDLRKTRRDLLAIVREVDERVEEVFTAAFNDVEREFAGVFARLFPGGEGRLILTDPSDMLATGVDVEARPPGKKVKRLSLLSGGERALVAVAFLVALFKARPSPFYVLDEVEAALDDINLGRLLEIYEELRDNSQLIVITHQKRTMEIADALYGTSMRGDGVTEVISQRLREAESA